jgi:hypothetical protein
MISDFFSAQDLNFEQVKCLTHALMALAKVDGVHDNEMKLIREFYESCSREGDPRLEEVAGGRYDPARAKPLFETEELKALYIKSLILLAFADGVYAQEEDDLIHEYASAIDVSKDQVASLSEATKEFLLGSLAHVQNIDALKEVKKRLDPK